MPFTSEQTKLTILLGTTIILLFGISVIALFNIFSKKSQLNEKEKEIMKASYEKNILQAQLEIQEYTFNGISQEIHDNVGQILSLAKLQIQLFIMNLEQDTDNSKLAEVKENISNAILNLRNIAKGLNSDRIMYHSILETVGFELDKIAKSGIAKTFILKDGEEQNINQQKKLILFRMIQESLQNVIKHAGASEITVSFSYGASELAISIKDNGNGFNAADVMEQKDGLGLMNIKKRALLAGGSAQIESVLEQGTTIHIRVPYE